MRGLFESAFGEIRWGQDLLRPLRELRFGVDLNFFRVCCLFVFEEGYVVHLSQEKER